MLNKARLQRRLQTEQTTLMNIDKEITRWRKRQEQQLKVVAALEKELEEADGD